MRVHFEYGGVDNFEYRRLLLFDFTVVAVILDGDGLIHWPTTMYLVDVARRSRSVTGDTVRTYAESLIVLLHYLSATQLSMVEITEERWGAYCAFLSRGAKNYSISSANLHLTVASNFLVWAQTTGWISSQFGQRLLELRRNKSHNAIRGRLRGEQTTQLRAVTRMPRFVGPEDFQRIARAAPLPYKLQFKWASCTGIRRFEVCGLRISDLSRSTSSGSTGLVQLQILRKGGRLRTIYAPATLIDETRWYILLDRPQPKPGFEDFVFLGERGTPTSRQCLTRVFRKVADSLGLDATLHHLRHTFAIQVLGRLQQFELRGDPINAIKALQILMGHSSIETTEIYLNAMDVTSDAVAQTLGYLYGESL
jgi:integrase